MCERGRCLRTRSPTRPRFIILRSPPHHFSQKQIPEKYQGLIISTVAGRRPLEKDTAYGRRDANQIFLYFCSVFLRASYASAANFGRKKSLCFRRKMYSTTEGRKQRTRWRELFCVMSCPIYRLFLPKEESVEGDRWQPNFSAKPFLLFLFLLVVAKMDSGE